MSVAKKYIVPLQYKFTSTVLLKVPSESQYLPNTVSTPKIRYYTFPIFPRFRYFHDPDIPRFILVNEPKGSLFKTLFKNPSLLEILS